MEMKEGREMTATNIETVTIAVVIKQKGAWIHDESATKISIESEGAGHFVQIRQEGVDKPGTIQIDPDEWESIKAATDRMILDAIALELSEDGEK